MDDNRVRILLVEDDPDDVWVMRGLLGDRWDGPFDLIHVEMLASAVEICQDRTFDVILLDLTLPDSSGLETFLTMHAHAGEDVPVVVLSGYDDEQTAMTAVKAGAQDYLVKGQVNDNVLVRSIRYAIERSKRYHVEAQLRDTSEEFRAAKEIQQKLYPSEAPLLDGFDIAGALHPAKATAGDYFDYIPMADGCVAVVVGDVSGHGMGPALLASETRACLRTLAQVHDDVGEILTRANRVLAGDTDDFHFVTLSMAKLDPHRRTMVYASSGQRAYLLHAGDEVTVLDSTSLPLGVQADAVVPEIAPIPLAAGDVIALFTDGVNEAESRGKVRFGIRRALNLIRAERNQPARTIVELLYQDIAGFCGHRPQRDDITTVIVRVLEPQ